MGLDHIPLGIAIPPKLSIFFFYRMPKGKSILLIYDNAQKLYKKWDKDFLGNEILS